MDKNGFDVLDFTTRIWILNVRLWANGLNSMAEFTEKAMEMNKQIKQMHQDMGFIKEGTGGLYG